MRNATVTLILTLVLSASIALAGSDGSGGQAASFREVKIGGRASAMGGAFTAVAEDGVGHLYNPAGLAQSRMYTVTFSYRAMQLDRRLGYASVAIPAREDARLSLSWLYAGTADLEARDDQGNIIIGGDISYSENLVGVNFAKRFAPWILVGGKLFYAQHDIANLSAYTVGVDFGTLFKIDIRKSFLNPAFPLLQLGAVVENLGASYRWATGKYWETRGRERGATVNESFPTNFRAGAALLSPEKYLISADLEFNTASIVKSHFGGEYVYNKLLALRAGLDDLHPTFGAGVFRRFDGFAVWVDFSYLTDKVDEGDEVLISFDLFF